MRSRYTRRLILASGGAVTAILAECLGGEEDGDDNETDGGASGGSNGESTTDYDDYPFEVDVIDERHEQALDQLFEAMVLFEHTPDVEVDATTLTGEFRGYYDHGEDYARLECDVEPASNGERSLDDGIVTSTILSQYAANAENPPDGFDVAYYDIESESDEPFDTQSTAAEEAVEFWEDQEGSGAGENETTSDEVTERDQGEDVLEFEDLVINEHELTVEEGEYLDEVFVNGVVENTGEAPYGYVEVGVRVDDSDGRQLDRYITNTTELEGSTEGPSRSRSPRIPPISKTTTPG